MSVTAWILWCLALILGCPIPVLLERRQRRQRVAARRAALELEHQRWLAVLSCIDAGRRQQEAIRAWQEERVTGHIAIV